MVQIRWNEETIEVCVDNSVRYTINSKGFFSHQINREIKGETIARVILLSPECRNMGSQPAVFNTIYEMCRRNVYLDAGWWECFEEIQKTCPEVRFIPSERSMRLYGWLAISDREGFCSFLNTNHTSGVIDLTQVILDYKRTKALEQA